MGPEPADQRAISTRFWHPGSSASSSSADVFIEAGISPAQLAEVLGSVITVLASATGAGGMEVVARTARSRGAANATLRFAVSVVSRSVKDMNRLPLLAPPSTRIHTSVRGGPTLLSVKEGLWRVIDRSGSVMGHIEKRTDADGERFAARRLMAATRTMELGVFWRIEDAAECFR